MDIGTLD